MGKIYVEPNETPLFSWDHNYLVYEDDNGDEWVTRGDPEKNDPLRDYWTLH